MVDIIRRTGDDRFLTAEMPTGLDYGGKMAYYTKRNKILSERARKARAKRLLDEQIKAQQAEQEWARTLDQLGSANNQGVDELRASQQPVSRYGSEDMWKYTDDVPSNVLPVYRSTASSPSISEQAKQIVALGSDGEYVPTGYGDPVEVKPPTRPGSTPAGSSSYVNPKVTYGPTRKVSDEYAKRWFAEHDRLAQQQLGSTGYVYPGKATLSKYYDSLNVGAVGGKLLDNPHLVDQNKALFQQANPGYQFSSVGLPSDAYAATAQDKAFNMIGRANPNSIRDMNMRKASQGLIDLDVPDWELERMGLGSLAKKRNQTFKRDEPSVSSAPNSAGPKALGNTMLGLSTPGRGGNQNNAANYFRTTKPGQLQA